MKKIRYKVVNEHDVQKIEPKSVEYNAYNLALAKTESYNGEYTIEDTLMTAEEARAQRDKLLEDTDWTQVLDAPIDTETREAYRAYRQALRDIPEQDGFPMDIIWPELPAKVKAAPDPVDEAVDLLLSGAAGEEAAT